ncbi:winged helix-turn-helix domain-containing protein [Phenylobacterium sp.]|uniref:winged helix-turn-helix domain-containing protein n=1 Tax=Phenylobacterium sp. TaxID=1871053 RepID=UPI0035B0FA6D
MADAGHVALAHEPDFIVGRLTISPLHRELVRDDGEREVLEHRVMQVLIALAKAKGAVVTRDELIMSCWDGRVVGEDAINRVISRLRKTASGIGADSFQIETITKIGYRLLTEAHGETPANDQGGETPDRGAAGASIASRRALLTGLAVLGVAGAAGGGAILFRRRGRAQVPPEVATLMVQASMGMSQDTPEGQSQALGLYRRVAQVAPEYADGWGLLSLAYACTAHWRPRDEMEGLLLRAQAAARRAQDLEPGNIYADVALSVAPAFNGRWLATERSLRHALKVRPSDVVLTQMLADVLCSVGRFEEALALLNRIGSNPRSPDQYYHLIQTQWGAQRIEELDRTIADAVALYPTQFAIWFSRFYIDLYSGDPEGAIALGASVSGRPSGIPPQEFDDIMAVARAARSRAPAEIAAVVATQVDNAHRASGKAENAIQFCCLFGRLDEAFAIAEAYYFERGFVVPDVRFTVAQGTYTTHENRKTQFLFQPSTKPLRADPRFARLTAELGLETYWRAAGRRPDYRLA